MAKLLRYSTALKNTVLDSGINAVFNSGKLQIRDGTRPASADSAPTGTLLAEIDLPADAFNAASNGSITKSGTWEDLVANNSGTGSWFRMKTTGDDDGNTGSTYPRLDGNVGLVGSTSDLELNAVAITAGDKLTIDTFTVTLPSA